MATSTDDEPDKKSEESRYECNICLEIATDAVISMCGHLFCWPCIHRWMETRPNNPVCPVCKSVIDKERLIPIYGRGPGGQKDPRDTAPPRPQGQREEAPDNDDSGFFGNPFDTNGINVSFGFGAFPFFGMGPTVAFQTGGGHGFRRAHRGHGATAGNGGPQENQRQMMARLMLTLAILFVVMIILS